MCVTETCFERSFHPLARLANLVCVDHTCAHYSHPWACFVVHILFRLTSPALTCRQGVFEYVLPRHALRTDSNNCHVLQTVCAWTTRVSIVSLLGYLFLRHTSYPVSSAPDSICHCVVPQFSQPGLGSAVLYTAQACATSHWVTFLADVLCALASSLQLLICVWPPCMKLWPLLANDLLQAMHYPACFRRL
jgi:hypothetical protein